jgi:hypothetical protein
MMLGKRMTMEGKHDSAVKITCGKVVVIVSINASATLVVVLACVDPLQFRRVHIELSQCRRLISRRRSSMLKLCHTVEEKAICHQLIDTTNKDTTEIR